MYFFLLSPIRPAETKIDFDTILVWALEGEVEINEARGYQIILQKGESNEQSKAMKAIMRFAPSSYEHKDKIKLAVMVRELLSNKQHWHRESQGKFESALAFRKTGDTIEIIYRDIQPPEVSDWRIKIEDAVLKVISTEDQDRGWGLTGGIYRFIDETNSILDIQTTEFGKRRRVTFSSGKHYREIKPLDILGTRIFIWVVPRWPEVLPKEIKKNLTERFL